MLFLTTVTILLFIAMPGIQAHSSHELINQEWEAFKTTFGKKYSNSSEDSFRKEIYLENRRKIAAHNNDAGNTYTLRMNQFGALLPHEFPHIRNGFKIRENPTLIKAGIETFLPTASKKVPESVDWRDKGYVTPVKDQGQCGSGYAFSATGALEGQMKRETGNLVSLSVQNLVDCSINFGNFGCDGGRPEFAFEYIKSNGGIGTEQGYPYEEEVGKYRYNPKFKGGHVKGYAVLNEGNEKKLKEAVATIGPIAVAIDASPKSFQLYSEGVYFDPECSEENLDHNVLVVGYGSENGEDYWLVKNSWGTN